MLYIFAIGFSGLNDSIKFSIQVVNDLKFVLTHFAAKF